MTFLGTLLKNQRSRDAHSAWNRPNLQAPGELSVTSTDFGDGEPIPAGHAGKRVGGKNLSPQLTWAAPPPGTTGLVLVVEDLDVPTPKPAVHCLAVIDPSRLDFPGQLPAGALAGREPGAGVQILRSTIGRGYHGPEPVKGHGPHRYTFQLFALAGPVTGNGAGPELTRARPRVFLSSLTTPVIARGRLTGTYER